MRKTIIGGIFLVSSFLMSLFSVQVYGEQNLSCIVYVNQLKKTRREYKDFNNLVIKPMKNEKRRLEKQLELETKEPKRLKDINYRLSKEIADNEARKQRISHEIEREPKQRKKNKKEKRVIKIEAGIQRQHAKIEANNERIEEIETTPPTIDELRDRIDKINEELRDENRLKSEKERERKLAQKTLKMCEDYNGLLKTGGPTQPLD